MAPRAQPGAGQVRSEQMRRSDCLDTIDDVSNEEGQASPTERQQFPPSVRPIGPDSPFANNIARLFRLHALSGAEAAELLHISQSTISEMDSGNPGPIAQYGNHDRPLLPGLGRAPGDGRFF